MNKMVDMDVETTDAEAEYFGLAETWDEELYGKLKRDRLIAMGVAAASFAVATLSVIAVMLLTPLKETEPYVVIVDRQTGYTETASRVIYNQPNTLTENEAYVLGQINQYIISRHTYDPLDQEERQLNVQLRTNSQEFRRYVREVNSDKARFDSSTRRVVTIKSIQPNLDRKTATIRFQTTIETPAGLGRTEHWIAQMDYEFVDLNIAMRLRHLNPLGFLVTGYRVDPEINQ